MIRAALIDLDGTLVDSNDAHAQVWVEAFRSEKVATTLARVRRLVGMSSEQIIPILCGARAESELGERITARHDHLFTRDHLPALRPMPGARELLMRLRRQSIKIVITTSGQERLAHELLKRARVSDLVDALVTSAPKQSAELVVSGLAAAGVSAREAAMIGDSPYDIEAAEKARVRAIGLLCGGWAPQALKGATAIYRDPADLVQHFDLSMFSKQGSSGSDVPFPMN